MNYGEELAYWYLRLNGFFPISNFVVHRSLDVPYTSDVDVLAVRPPHVFEQVGGSPDDWDPYLSHELQFDRMIGLICEVKTGAFDSASLFRTEKVGYTLPRLGLVSQAELEPTLQRLLAASLTEVGGNACIAKLFISASECAGPYLNRTLANIEDFLAERVRRYNVEKYADRMFFPSGIFQLVIAQVHRAIEQRGRGLSQA